MEFKEKQFDGPFEVIEVEIINKGEKIMKKGILELCLDLTERGKLLEKQLKEQKEYRKKLAEFWKKVDENKKTYFKGRK